MQADTSVLKNTWPLEYQWIANFQDGAVHQFPDDGPEVNFRDVLARQDELDALTLMHWSGKFFIMVDLTNGVISFNGDLKFHPMLGSETIPVGTRFRVIYYRRVRQHMRSDGKDLGRETAYYIGWQTTIDGRNVKRIFSIDHHGRIGVE